MRRYLPYGMLFALALLLAACVAPATTPPSTPVGTPSADMEPQRGGTLVLVSQDDIAGPAGDFDHETTFDIALMSLYLDKLMLQKQDNTMEPRLAEEISLSEDGLTWTVRLQPNAKWHDGEPIVAEDLIYVINTICSGKTVPPARVFQFVDIEGCQAYQNGEVEGVSGLTKIDDKTVEIKTVKPNVALYYQLGFTVLVPYHIWKDVPLDSLNADPGWLDQPVGSGPFKMVNYVGDQVIEFEAFDDYYLGRPYLDKIIVRIASYDTALAALEASEVDLVAYVDILDADRLRTNPAFTVDYTQQNYYWGLFYHFYREELRDPRVRQALSYALNREAYNQNVLGGFGSTNIKMWYTPGTWPANPELPGETYDPEQARQLLEEAGFDFSQHMGLALLAGYEPLIKIGEMIQADLAEIGVTLDLYTIEETIILEEWINKQDVLWFTFANWGGTGQDPYRTWPTFYTDSDSNWGFYMCRFASPDLLQGKTPLEACGNYIYGSPELDELMDQALTIADPEEAKPIMWQIDQLLWENPSGLAVIAPAEIHAWNSRLHGVQPGNEYNLAWWMKPELWWVEQ